MTFPTQFTLIASTTEAEGNSGPVNLGAIATKWAVEIVSSGTLPTVNFTCSTDGTNYAPVTPANTRGGWLTFDVPAEYVTCSMSQAGATNTVAIFVVALSD